MEGRERGQEGEKEGIEEENEGNTGRGKRERKVRREGGNVSGRRIKTAGSKLYKKDRTESRGEEETQDRERKKR